MSKDNRNYDLEDRLIDFAMNLSRESNFKFRIFIVILPSESFPVPPCLRERCSFSPNDEKVIATKLPIYYVIPN